MEHSLDATEMLENLMCPAFIVKDGIITYVSRSASQRQISAGTKVSELIEIGIEDYAQYTAGKLCLTLRVNDTLYSTTVTTAEHCHIFCLASDYEEPELRAFALAAQHLREPLTNALSGTQQLIPNATIQTDLEASQQLAHVNRSLHQLLRAVCNMSDAVHYIHCKANHMQTRDIVAVFAEILEKAEALISQTGKTLNYSLPQRSVYTLVDDEKMERAVLNLISNAVKYTPKEGIIKATLQHRGNRLIFTVQDSGDGIGSQVRSNVFSRFLREPGIDDGRSGIGLGLSIVRAAATAHGGTLLMEQPGDAGARFTMTIAVKQSEENLLKTPILLPVDYAGGGDHALLELADALPSSVYKNI